VRIVAAGGGTGGHLFPLLAILEELGFRVKTDVLFFSVKGKIDDRLVRRDHPSYRIVPLKLRGLKRPIVSYENVGRAWRYLAEYAKVRKHIRAFKPDVAVLTGGYISAVVGFAIPSSVPIFVHEQNVIPGLANRALLRKARKFFISFEKSMEYIPECWRWKVEVTGNPVRDLRFSKEKIEVPDGIVLVLGGSLGSEFLNSLMEKVYELDKGNFYVHSTGSRKWTERLSRFENVLTRDFIEHMPIYWRKSKFVIARAGASTIAEMIYHRVGGILVPWKGSAESHQLENAKIAAERLSVEVLDEEELRPEYVVEKVKRSVYHRKSPLTNPSKKIVDSIMEEIS